MSNYIKIFIDGQLVDLPQDFSSLRLTYALKDRKGLAINTGSRSEYSFEFPATKQNDTIFSAFWDVGRLNFDKQKFLTASIEVDGMPYFQGKAQLTSVTTQDNQYYWKGKRYKVAFYGNNADWVQDIRDKRLRDYTLPTHIFNNGNIALGWGNAFPSSDWGYTLIKWKDWAFPNRIQYQESTPFVFVGAFLREIFDDIGYTVDSKFTKTDFFERLIMPIPLPKKFDGGFSEDYLTIEANEPTFLLSTNVGPTNPTILSNQTLSPATGPNPYDTGTGVYTVPYNGFYKFEYTANITNITGSGVGLIVFIVDVAGTFYPATRIGDTAPGSYAVNSSLRGEYVLQLTAGQTVGMAHAGNTTVGDADIELSMRITGELPATVGTPIDFKYLIPQEWKSLDFLKGLAHAFNLVFQTNTILRQVTIEPADSYQYVQESPSTSNVQEGFYNDTKDQTQQIDLLKDGELESRTDEPLAYRLKWITEGDTEEAINEREEIGFLEGRYLFPVDRYVKNEKVIENPFFASTLCILDQAITHEDSPAFCQIPIIWPKNYLEEPTSAEADYNIRPRLLQKQPQIPLSDRAFVRLDNGSGGYGSVLCPLAYMVDYNNLNGRRMSLSFGNTTVNGNEIAGLLDRFYLADMKRRQVGKDLEIYLSLSLLDIVNLDFRKNVILKDIAYILQEINSFDVLSDKSTKTYLQYAAQVENSDSDNIESSSVENKIVSG